MNSIIEIYINIYKKLDSINSKIESKQAEMSALSDEREDNVDARIQNLKETLERIDEVMLVVKGFQEHAKNYLDSTNILTIEAPPGYRVNVNRLRNWATLIDPTASVDPYAQRIYVVAKCDECFLTKKKAEFEEKIKSLEAADSNLLESELYKFNRQISAFKTELREYSNSPEIEEFIRMIIELNQKYWHNQSPAEFKNETEENMFIAPGAMALPLPLDEGSIKNAEKTLGNFYDAKNNKVLIPYELPTNKEFIMTISCVPSRSKQLEKGIQNYILNNLINNKAGSQKIYIFDASRYNTSSLGHLKTLEDTFAIQPVPRNPEKLTAALETLVSNCTDYDEIIDLYDSLREYNESNDEKQLPKTLLVLYGWPNAFSSSDKELINKIMMNYERYGVSLIAVSYSMETVDDDKKSDTRSKFGLPEYALNNSINIVMRHKETIINEPEKNPKSFVWYSFNDKLNENFEKDIKNIEIKDAKKGNEYINWFSVEEENLPDYTRDYKPLLLPFGIDAKEKIHELTFENENFAAYLVGASRSGKSTLIHTLIASIIRNYHPDNVELWLADFKQLEFESYIKNCPPHVKYVLLDESTELIFDLIDKLTDIMMERQRLFANKGVDKINKIDVTTLSKPLPLIFVILDEFSIMSQKLEASDVYKIKLQNLLAKGAALGIRFIFSSQTFTSGVSGLTKTARAQIQQRIAMKSSPEEIDATLELSSNLKTDQVKNWISAFPPHYALVKQKNEDSVSINKMLVLYFDGYDERDNMIQAINRKMRAVDKYNVDDITTFVNKHPVLVDGKSYKAYSTELLKNAIADEKKNHPDDFSGDETFVLLGKPRLMTETKLIPITPESRENMLLIAGQTELNCAASILESAMDAFKAQGANVNIWSYKKNKIFKNNKANWEESGYTSKDNLDDICDSIKELKEKIIKGEENKELIVLLGFDRICSEFEFANGQVGSSDVVSYEETVERAKQENLNSVNQAALVTDEEAQIIQPIKLSYQMLLVAIKKKDNLTKEGLRELQKELTLNAFMENPKKCYEDYGVAAINLDALLNNIDRYNKFKNVENSEDQNTKEPEAKAEKVEQKGFYNAAADFEFIIKQGSRLGYHFVMVLNNYSDLKQTKIKLDLFRHRLTFQLSKDDSHDMIRNRSASELPEHVCQYYNTLNYFSFRPYIHKNISWEGWYVDENGEVKNRFEE